MTESDLKKAKNLFKQRNFSAVIAMLEPRVIDYRDSYDFFYLLGVSCMYANDIGGAQDYLKRAAQLKENDADSIVAQAALFLRRGDTNKAVEYYLEALEYDPGNAKAKRAMTFIRTKGDIATISQWVSNGKIKKFYPDIAIYVPIVPLACVAVAVLLVFIVIPMLSKSIKLPQRADLSDFALSVDEKKNPVDMQGGVYTDILTSGEVTNTYNKAIDYFQKNRDNAAQVEINRILNSNASNQIRTKARLLMDFMQEPTFENIQDSYSYAEVAKAPYLYQDCWVVWSGSVVNVRAGDSFYECDFAVGFETRRTIEGIIPLSIPQPVTIDEERPLKILAQLDIRGKELYLNGKTVYQPLNADKIK